MRKFLLGKVGAGLGALLWLALMPAIASDAPSGTNAPATCNGAPLVQYTLGRDQNCIRIPRID